MKLKSWKAENLLSLTACFSNTTYKRAVHGFKSTVGFSRHSVSNNTRSRSLYFVITNAKLSTFQSSKKSIFCFCASVQLWTSFFSSTFFFATFQQQHYGAVSCGFWLSLLRKYFYKFSKKHYIKLIGLEKNIKMSITECNTLHQSIELKY